MQSIERYGVVALVFLAVTVAAVLMWEGESSSDTVAAAESDRAAVPETSNTVLAHASAQRNRPLRRAEMQEAPPASPASDRPSLDELREESRAGISPARTESPPAEGREPDPPGVDEPPVPVADEETPPRESARTERSEPDAAPNVYVVKDDDQTLGHIAMRELGTWRRYTEIVELNPGLDPAKLRVGARLVMPSTAPTSAPVVAEPTTPPAAPAAETSEATPSGPTYTVIENDSLWKIAARTLGDGARWGDIAEVNPGIDVDHLTVGQVLRLPSGASEVAAAPATPSTPEVAATEAPASERRGRVR